MKGARWLMGACVLVLCTVLSACGMISGLGGSSDNTPSGFDISNPKNLAWMCARSDQTVDWQACLEQVNQVCGDQNHPVKVALYGPLQTNHPFYNGFYITFQCEEGYSDGQPLNLVDPVSGADVQLQTPQPPAPLPSLGYGDDDGSTPPATTTPPVSSAPPAAPPASSTPSTPPASSAPSTPPPATGKPSTPPVQTIPPASSTPSTPPPSSSKPANPPAQSSTSPGQGKAAPVTIISS